MTLPGGLLGLLLLLRVLHRLLLSVLLGLLFLVLLLSVLLRLLFLVLLLSMLLWLLFLVLLLGMLLWVLLFGLILLLSMLLWLLLFGLALLLGMLLWLLLFGLALLLGMLLRLLLFGLLLLLSMLLWLLLFGFALLLSTLLRLLLFGLRLWLSVLRLRLSMLRLFLLLFWLGLLFSLLSEGWNDRSEGHNQDCGSECCKCFHENYLNYSVGAGASNSCIVLTSGAGASAARRPLPSNRSFIGGSCVQNIERKKAGIEPFIMKGAHVVLRAVFLLRLLAKFKDLHLAQLVSQRVARPRAVAVDFRSECWARPGRYARGRSPRSVEAPSAAQITSLRAKDLLASFRNIHLSSTTPATSGRNRFLATLAFMGLTSGHKQ